VGWAEGLGGKWLELLQETVPRLSTVAVIVNPDTAIARDLVKELQSVAPARGLRLDVIEERDASTLDHAFERAARKAQAVVVLPAPIFSAQRGKITALAARHRLPTMYYLRDYVEAGGLMAYAPDLALQFRRAADYVDKILRGARPAELPIEQPTQWTLVVNLKVAKALGLKMPESILLRADELLQ
jgi:putative ABC transport system substrate-binding protein